MLSWTTTLSFFETLRRVCFFWFWFCCRLNAKNEGVGCTFEYQIFCKVGVCFDVIDTTHREQTWWVPSVASRYWVQMWVHVDISNPMLLFWPSLLTSSLGEDIPKSQSHDFWESLPRSIAFKGTVPVASCLATYCMFVGRETTKSESHDQTFVRAIGKGSSHRLKLGPRHLASPWWFEWKSPTSKNSFGQIQTLKWAWFNEGVCRDSHGI